MANAIKIPKSLKIAMIIISVVIIGVGIFVLIGSFENNRTAKYTDPEITFKSIPEDLTDDQKKEISDEIISKLKTKYGADNEFEIIEIRKGRTEAGCIDDACSQGGAYFDVSARIISEIITTDFEINYINKKDNLMGEIRKLYDDEISEDFKRLDSRIEKIKYFTNKECNDKNSNYESIFINYGSIPTKQYIQSRATCVRVDINLEYNVNTEEDLKTFMTSYESDLKNITGYSGSTFSRAIVNFDIITNDNMGVSYYPPNILWGYNWSLYKYEIGSFYYIDGDFSRPYIYEELPVSD